MATRLADRRTSGLGGAIAEMHRIESRELPRQTRRQRAQVALELADGLLNALEELQLDGRVHVPLRYGPRLDRLQRAALDAGIPFRSQSLEPGRAIMELMDDIFDVEGKIFRRYASDLRARKY